jgi:hypothetical protein
VIVLSWIAALAGLLVGFVVSLVGAMKAVPVLHWQEALVAVPLPVLAIVLAGSRFSSVPTASFPSRPRWLAAGVPILLGVLTLLHVANSYFDQPGGPR